MTLPIVFRPEALDDLAEAFLWHEQQRSGLGAEFMAAVDAKLQQVQAGPNQFPRARGLIRPGLSSIVFHTASFLLRILRSLTSLPSCTMRAIRHIGVDVRRLTANNAPLSPR